MVSLSTFSLSSILLSDLTFKIESDNMSALNTSVFMQYFFEIPSNKASYSKYLHMEYAL
jgi:hypothetical protein